MSPSLVTAAGGAISLHVAMQHRNNPPIRMGSGSFSFIGLTSNDHVGCFIAKGVSHDAFTVEENQARLIAFANVAGDHCNVTLSPFLVAQ